VVFTQNSLFGTVRNVQPCPDCRGTGKIVREKCTDCHGAGYISRRRTIKVAVPAGIDNGQSIRIRDKGEPGTNGGPRGDLLVEVRVERHPIFQRQEYDIYTTVPISFARAALGGDMRIYCQRNLPSGTVPDGKLLSFSLILTNYEKTYIILLIINR